MIRHTIVRNLLLGLLLLFAAATRAGEDLERQSQSQVFIQENLPDRSFTIRTPRLEVTFKNGRIVHLKHLLTGKLICDERLAGEGLLPGGIGRLSDNVSAMCAAHSPWGTHPLNGALETGIFYPNQHFPDDRSSFKLERNLNGVVATWTGLANGKEHFPAETLSISASLDAKDGSLRFTAAGTSGHGGVFGGQVPLVNIIPGSRFFLPSFGGLEYDRAMPPAVMSWGGAPFIEVPAVAFETETESVGLWSEDEQFSPFYAFLGWNGRSFAFAFEHQNLMPFEPRKHFSSGVWKLDVFAGGWQDALKPYKEWYATRFAPELKIRDSVEWADRIRVVMDSYDSSSGTLRKIASLFDPSTVMLHNWNARAPEFDRDLPDWTPRAGYVEAVKLAHSYGFRTMAYVNTYCINYNSPFFIRDNLKDIFLTRKLSIYQYEPVKSTNAINELLIGTINQARGADQFAGMPDGKILYGDPLSPAWRKYHIDQMKVWNSKTGTDANYEDTAGCAGDFGNGVVDGAFAQQGSIRMMRELLAAQPHVPMASEYGPSPIAFAVRWPLNYAQVWGDQKFRQFRMHRQRPVSSFLFGFRQWIPVVNAETDFLRHLVAACSDSSGGMAQSPGTVALLEADRGMLGHIKWRAQLFSRLLLTPHFPPGRSEKDVVCHYKDKDGRIYKYLDDGFIQRMKDPDGEDLYMRVSGIESVDTPLSIPGWPVTDGSRISGLDPELAYALFPLDTPEKQPALRLRSLPKGVKLARYSEDKFHALMRLEAVSGGPDKAEIDLELAGGFPSLRINGRLQIVSGRKTLAAKANLPASILYSMPGKQLKPGQQIGSDTETMARFFGQDGLEIARHGMMASLAKNMGMYVFPDIGMGEGTAEFLFVVPDRNSALRMRAKNGSSRHGDATSARIYVNGRIVHAHDFGSPDLSKQSHDQQPREWTIPLGTMAGQTILVSIASDRKLNGNSDQQWFSIPELVEDEAQKITEKIPGS